MTSGPVYRKGYWSQVTAGPKTGFGLLPSDDGIAFYNSQLLTSVTPITDFQNQIARDPQGRRAAKLYEFSATTTTTRPSSRSTRSCGPRAWRLARPTTTTSTPRSARPPSRAEASAALVAGLIGMNQNKITQKVYEGAIGQFRQRIPQEAQEEAQERIAGEMAQRNADLSQYLIGNNMAGHPGLPDHAACRCGRGPRPSTSGGCSSRGPATSSAGPMRPSPPRLAVPDPGLTADVHLSSVLTSAVDGLFQRPEVQAVDNVMILTKDVPPGTPPRRR